MLAVLPTTVASAEPGQPAPSVDYTVNLPAAGRYRVVVRVLPTHPIVGGRLTRVSVALGDAPAQVISTGTRDGSAEWSQAVLSNTAAANATFDAPAAGPTRLRIQMVDAGIALEGLTIESAEGPDRSGKKG